MTRQVHFLADYRGVLTAELYYQAGTTAELPGGAALELHRRGLVALVDDGPEPDSLPPQPPKPEPVLAVDIEELSVSKLRGLAKAAGIKGYSRMKRPRLIAELRDD